jgi:hypothetical protein
MNLFTPSQWLTPFLSARNFNTVSGNSLFSYQMTLEEYKALRKIIFDFYPHKLTLAQ